MPAYLIQHAKGQHGDMLIEDPTLTLTVTEQWAILTDDTGICVAIPTAHIASIQRVNETPDTDDGPAPER